MRMKMKEQINKFLECFNSIENKTNPRFSNKKIESLTFNPEFHNALIENKYISLEDTKYKGYDLVVDNEEDADYWGMFLKVINK